MYFSYIPYIKYDEKPIKYPFSEADYTITKNFFRRYKVNDDVFSYAVFFKRYSIQDVDRLDTLAQEAYGNAFYDWIIVLTNNMINPLFDWPMSEYDLRKHVEANYENPYSDIKYYRTYEIKNSKGEVVLKENLIVDENFYNSPFKYWDTNQTITVNGSEISRPITVFEYEQEENEKKREIYLLKPRYLDSFIEEFRKNNLYKQCSDYVTAQLKKTAA